MSWAELFEQASAVETTVDEVCETLDRHRSERDEGPSEEETGDHESVEPSPVRLVADADVLAADLLVGGAAREALDHPRSHSWVVLVASDPLVDDAAAVIESLADASLAADWRVAVDSLRERVTHPAGDHPALASADRGGAMHLITFDDGLQSAGAGMAIRQHVETSLKSPDAFARLFDPARLYPEVAEGAYPGSDRDPRD